MYNLVYVKGYELLWEDYHFLDMDKVWKKGDVFAYLYKTDKANIFKAHVYAENKSLSKNNIVKFDNGNLRMYTDEFDIYRKIYPDTSEYEVYKGSMTGFGIGDNRIISCYHGLDKADTEIKIKGINGDFSKSYKAEIDRKSVV